MNNKIFNINETIISDTYYSAKQVQYDIYLRDTIRIEDKIFLSISDTNDGFLNVAFHLHGLKNVTLDFNGAILTLHGRIQPFIIDKCENVTIKNLIVEYDRSFFSEFDIISNDNGHLKIRPKEKFPCSVENGYLIPYSETWENNNLNNMTMFLQVFDSVTREGVDLIVVAIGEKIISFETPPCTPIELKVKEDEGDIVLSGNIPQKWKAGMTAVIAHEQRDKTGISICRSKDISLENYRILNGAGMGIFGIYTENLYINGLKLYHDNLSHGIITNAADAIHLVSCFGTIRIENSIIEGMVDDALNVHGNFYLTKAASENRIQAYKSTESHFLNAHCQMFDIGDMIAVYNAHTTEIKTTFIIKNITLTGDYAVEIETDKLTNVVTAGDIIENLSAQPELTIKNCKFGKSNTHLRIQTRGKSFIENCESSLPILLTGDLNYWYEASPVNDLTIRFCRFIGERADIRIISECNPVPNAPYYHSGIKIINNVFDVQTALMARNADNITYIHNRRSGANATTKIELSSCGEADTDCETVRY